MTVKDNGLQLITEVIKSYLNIEVNCLMGANLAPEVAAGYFCETTIGKRYLGLQFIATKQQYVTDS